MNKSRDGVTISQYSFSESIDPLIQVQNYIKELNFKIENIEEAYTILQNHLSELHSKFNELKNNNIIGMVEIDNIIHIVPVYPHIKILFFKDKEKWYFFLIFIKRAIASIRITMVFIIFFSFCLN